MARAPPESACCSTALLPGWAGWTAVLRCSCRRRCRGLCRRRRRRVEEPVAAHLEAEGLQFMQFAFRWVNCLLLREVPFGLAVRLWDTYLSEG